MKRPKIDILNYEEASDLSRCICDEPRQEPSIFRKGWNWFVDMVVINWQYAHGTNKK